MTGHPHDLRSVAHALGGEVCGAQVLAPGPVHSHTDRSLSVRLNANAPDGFVAFSFAGDNWRVCRDHIRERLGIEHQPQMPNQRAAMRSRPPLRRTPGERYLAETRKIETTAIADILDRTDAIGWHESVLFREGGHALDGKRLGCIVGVMSDPATATPTGAISRTYVHEKWKIGKA
jgi:hypothetical protein